MTAKATAQFTKGQQPATITADGYYYFDVPGPLGSRDTEFNTLYAEGDFGGGQLQLYVVPDYTVRQDLDVGKSLPVSDVVLTSSGFQTFQVKSCGYIVRVTGSTNPNLKVWIK